MKPFFLIVLSWLMLLAAPARADVSFDYFYESLSPYGIWIDTPEYGYCWQPAGVSEEWAPYTDGYWVYTDAGWTWVSYEPFGALTYHYGRWVRLAGIGWVWRPDYEWGPAWVSWRSSDDYIGWAPLPPEAVFEPEVGIGIWVDRDYDIGPGYYSFCRVADFGSPVLLNVIYPRYENVTIIYNTVNITHITVNRGHRVIYNRGPDYHRISRHTRRPIETLRLERRYDVGRKGHLERSRREGNHLVVTAPRIERRETDRKKAPARVSRRVERVNVDRGWASVSNGNERQRLEEKIRREARDVSRTKTPVKPVEQVALPTPPNRRSGESSASQSRERESQREQQRRQTETEPRQRTETRQREAQEQRQQVESQQREAQRQRQQTETQQREAQKQRQQVETQQREAQEQRQRQQAEAQQREAQRQRQQVESQQREAQRQRQQAESQQREAQRQRQQMESQQREAQRQRQQMESQQREAQRQRQQMESQQREAQRQRQQMESQQREAQRQRQQMESQQREAQRQQAESRQRDSERQRQETQRQQRDSQRDSERQRR